MKPLIICWIAVLAPAAWGAPTIAVTSPATGQPLHNVTPLLTVTYSATSPGLDLATLQVLVNDADWTARFTKTAASASYQVTAADAFTAGTLTLSASIRDTAGTLATITKTYAVHPTLLSLTPNRGIAGIDVTVAGRGLDVNADRNVLIFPSAQTGPALRVPFTTVDPVAGTGMITVPVGLRTGDVTLEVNQRASQAGKLFSLQGSYAVCGLPWDIRFFANGDLLVMYPYYFGVQGSQNQRFTDPECIPFYEGFSTRSTLARLRPDRSVSILVDFWPQNLHDDGALLGMAVRKDGVGFAYMWQDRNAPSVPLYNITTNAGVTVTLAGIEPYTGERLSNLLAYYYPIYLDFDVAGNLYFASYPGAFTLGLPLRLYRVSAERLASGGLFAPDLVREFPEYTMGEQAVLDFDVLCDGTVYMVLGSATPPYRRLRRTSVTGVAGDVEWSLALPAGAPWTGLARATPSCRGGELLVSFRGTGSIPLYGGRHAGGGTELLGQVDQGWYSPGSPNGAASADFLRAPAAMSPAGEFVVAPWWGFVPMGTGAGGCGASPNTWPCPPLNVSATTPRWSPTRRATPLAIQFTSPYDLSSATLEVRDPAGTLMPAQTAPLVTTGPQAYRLDWTLPAPEPGEGEALAPGHYRLVVVGVRADGQGAATSAERVMSLVEVSEVRFEALPDAPLLDDNPPVPALVEQGQDPGLGRPGGGKRLFAESTTVGGPVHNRVKVVVVTTPMLTPDTSQPPEATTVRVFLRSFDVDDPAPAVPDKDGDATADAVDDNRGVPGNGTLADAWLDIPAGSATASTELTVSLQPGDNYRVVASTGAEWLASVQARQRVAPDEPVQDGAVTVEGGTVSPMLTVWRSLHLEIDSMAAPPPETAEPGALGYAERNFIKGRLTRMETHASPDFPGQFNQFFYVETEATTPPLRLADGSVHWPNAAGRFQNGRLTFGVGPEAFVASSLTGNGDDASGEYVLGSLFGGSVPPPYAIPYRATNGTLRERAGTVIWWNTATRVFTLTPVLPSAFVGGTLRVAGQDWPIVGVSGGDVTVGGTQEIPAQVLDDDAAAHPFEVNTALLQPVADPTQNPFAQAYILPRAWTPTGATQAAPFTRNVCGNCEPNSPAEREATIAALVAGRDLEAAMPAFWTGYVQASFQHATTDDNDPGNETGAPGFTPAVCDRWGSILYSETLRDVIVDDGGMTLCAGYEAKAAAHEVGHQFGLHHACTGIMTPGCDTPRYFTAPALAAIRTRNGATICDAQPTCQ